jgi:cyclic pyranopterin phosphate synthase
MTERIIQLLDRRLDPSSALPAGVETPSGELRDRFDRRLHDLRISVTDRCNFRCTYCMPKGVFDRSYRFLPHADLLSFEEITRLARIFVAHGVEKIRLTGGEPLLRRDLERLIEQLARLTTPGGAALDLTLTTNGALLARKARALADAGLKRITVSLDALDDTVFRRLNDVDFPVHDVLDGIEAAAAAGLAPLKINMVVRRGENEDQIVPMAHRFRQQGHILRLIEFMDVGNSNGWRHDDVVPAAEIVKRIDAEMPLAAAAPNYPGEVAERWHYRDGSGEIGVIASVTQAFCRDCTRARLSTEGRLYTCLFAHQGTDLRQALRSGAGDDELAALVGQVWRRRTDRYSELRSAATAGPVTPKIEMSYIGG